MAVPRKATVSQTSVALLGCLVPAHRPPPVACLTSSLAAQPSWNWHSDSSKGWPLRTPLPFPLRFPIPGPSLPIQTLLDRSYSAIKGRRNGGNSRLFAGGKLRPNSRQRRVQEAKKLSAAEDPSVSAPNEAVTAVVRAPEHEGGVVKRSSSAAVVLGHAALAVTRQIEMLNVFLGFEQANKYTIADVHGNPLGFIAEEEGGFGSALKRQVFRNHRPFRATVMNSDGEVILKVERPFSIVNSRATVSLPDGRVIGGVYQRWHLWRRLYDLVALAPGGSHGEQGMRQFAVVDAPFLSWDFKLQDERGGLLGTIDRNFTGFAREFFTDTGHYVLRMDSVEGGASRSTTLDERAVTLGAAISIDIDYFSRNRHGVGVPIPIPVGSMPVPASNPPVPMPIPVGGAVGAAEAAEIGAGAATGAAVGGAASIIGDYTSTGTSRRQPEGDSAGYIPPPTMPETSGPVYNEWGDEIVENEGFVSDDQAFPDGQNHGSDSSWGETLSSFIWHED